MINRLCGSGLAMRGIDLIELDEAFASQALAAMRQLGLPDDVAQVNPQGGIALGHLLGMSGARLALTAVNALESMGRKRAVAGPEMPCLPRAPALRAFAAPASSPGDAGGASGDRRARRKALSARPTFPCASRTPSEPERRSCWRRATSSSPTA